MKLFYIPDGHRRYAQKMSCSLEEAYNEGLRVLIEEILNPLFQASLVTSVDVFCLSNLNLQRRDERELEGFLRQGPDFLRSLIDRCSHYASIRTVGTYLPENISIKTVPDRQITLVIGSRTADDLGCPPVDIFIRSGGELRLSGAPRSVIGDYTQFYVIDELHPLVRAGHIMHCLKSYRSRYRRSTDTPILKTAT